MDVKALNKSLRQATAELREFSRALDSLTRFVAGDAAAPRKLKLVKYAELTRGARRAQAGACVAYSE